MSAKEFAESVLEAAAERDAIHAEGGTCGTLFLPTEREKEVEELSRAYLEAIRRDA